MSINHETTQLNPLLFIPRAASISPLTFHFLPLPPENQPPAVPTAMAQPGFHRFPHPLDPTAQEFRPTTYHLHLYSFPPPPPPPTMVAFMFPVPSPALPPSSTVPTRALLLSSVPTNASESTVRRDLEVFGDVRAVQMERLLRDGIVTVHFYDLRQATEALNKIQEQHMQQQRRLRQHFDGLTLSLATPPLPARGLVCGRVVWAQFAFPMAAGLPDRYNQGSVVVTLDSDVLSTGDIRDVFEAFGDVKQITSEKTQKIVEFYDTRAASRAVATVNGQEINGKKVAVEFNRDIGPNLISYHSKPKKVVVPNVEPPPCRPPPPCRKDRLVVVREVRSTFGNGGGLKKKNVVYNNNNNNNKQRRQSPEKWVSGNGGGRNKAAWKGRCDPRFLIKDEAAAAAGAVISGCFQDSRTTVMIKNIPNKYSQKLLLNMLDSHCIECNELLGEDDQQLLSSYDFVYLPIDFVNKCNVGYGFVNMTSAEGAWRLYKAFNHQKWEVFNSKKICEVSYARLQGLETLKEHFKNSRFPCEEEEYMPVVFTPPRDGRTVTEPIPIVGRTTITSKVVEVVGCGHHDLTDDDDASRSSSSSSSDSSNNNNRLLVEDGQSDATGASSTGGGGI